jgi:hypothetical protein
MCARFAVRYSSLSPFDPDAVARELTDIFLGGLASNAGSLDDTLGRGRR